MRTNGPWRRAITQVCDLLGLPPGTARVETCTPPGVRISRGGYEIESFGDSIQSMRTPTIFVDYWTMEVDRFNAQGAVRKSTHPPDPPPKTEIEIMKEKIEALEKQVEKLKDDVSYAVGMAASACGQAG